MVSVDLNCASIQALPAHSEAAEFNHLVLDLIFVKYIANPCATHRPLVNRLGC